jgi:RNase H-fold protein (predicted Holliday junction resolvase)
VNVLGIDPGTRKCGFAVLARAGEPALTQGIVALDALAAALDAVVRAYPIAIAAVGRGTNATNITPVIAALGVPYELVDERATTLEARGYFFRDHPPRGWKRFVPRGMLLPDRPIDDYAAVLIAERLMHERAARS